MSLEIEPELEQSEWFRTRHPSVQEVVRRYPPHLVYRLPDGQLAKIHSYLTGEPPAGCLVVRAWIGCTGQHSSTFPIHIEHLTPVPEEEYAALVLEGRLVVTEADGAG